MRARPRLRAQRSEQEHLVLVQDDGGVLPHGVRGAVLGELALRAHDLAVRLLDRSEPGDHRRHVHLD